MAGYYGYSKSNNAITAENQGRFPISQAKKIVSAECNITQSLASKFLKGIYSGEYHHSSKFYNIVDYYDAAKIIAILEMVKDKLSIKDNINTIINSACSAGLNTYDMDDEECVDNFIFEINDRI